jgi:signal transduction histidine kinase
MSKQSKPKSIEANLVSLGALAATLGVVLLVALIAVGQGLGSRLEQMKESIVPAEQAVTGAQQAMARLFQRQSQVLATRNTADLELYRDSASLTTQLTQSSVSLRNSLSSVLDEEAAAVEGAKLDQSLAKLLNHDQALFDSVQRRHGYQEKLDSGNVAAQKALQKLIQEAHAVAGDAHLEYVLTLRRVVRTPSPQEVRKLVLGGERVQQEAAGDFVTGALHLGQLGGKIALAASDDELNSIAANELAQNLDRSRSYLRAILSSLDPESPVYTRATEMQKAFELVAADISDAKNPKSLINLRRGILSEAENGVVLRKEVAASVQEFSHLLDVAQRAVANMTEHSAKMASRTLWAARFGTLIVLAGAVWVGLGSVRRMRESVDALRGQNTRLASLSGELKSMNEGLEELVAQRSAQLLARERSMRLVLDTVEEALVMCDLEGKIAGECSKVAIDWFGALDQSKPIWRYLAPTDRKLQDRIRMGFEQIAEDLLPFEASVSCLPSRIERDGRIFALEFSQVFEEGRFKSVLVTAKDVTEQVASEARERDAREQQMLLANLLKDKGGFRAFVREGEGLLADLRTQPEREPTMRALHTLKGNTAVYGMESVARYCHQLEDKLSEETEVLTSGELDELTSLWRTRIHKIEEMVTSESSVELAETDYSEMVNALRQRKDHDQLIHLVESWKWSATSAQLQRLSRQLRRVAERLDKHIEVTVEHNRLRVIPGPLDAFWGALVHVVRNAVDHGIESPEQRSATDKPENGRITLRSELRGGHFVVELQDDGRGIDFERLKRVAEAKGLPVATHADLVAAMFHDGVTTRDEATELSGRGVGLAAVSDSCRRVGGRVECDSSLGVGTTFRFVFPLDAVQVRQGTPPTGTRSPSAIPPSMRRAV